MPTSRTSEVQAAGLRSNADPRRLLHAMILALAGAALAPGAAHADGADTDTLSLSLEDLMKVEVTSVSRKTQTLADTPAAAYVITADDIHRSGATSIPEALRLAPGVQVSAMGNDRWAVSIRGFADRLANKLLVLVDGRSVYTPLFSGVLWETLDVPLESIARIEVIRGPGASVWGANAVNGVVNIITRPAFESQGLEAAGAAGTELRGYGTLRYGWDVGPDTALSLRVAAQDVGDSRAAGSDEPAHDALQQRSLGASLEHLMESGRLRVQGSLAHSAAEDAVRSELSPPSLAYVPTTQHTDSEYLRATWEGALRDGRQSTLQADVTHNDLDHALLGEQRTTANLEFRQRALLGDRHDLVWGLAYRYTTDRLRPTTQFEIPRAEQSSLYSAFVQDDIVLRPERWRLSLGARLDHNEYSGLGAQPNLRLLWTPGPNQSAWLSLAHALRTPSRIEQGNALYRYPFPVTDPAMPLPAIGESETGPIGDERLNAIDVGWRSRLGAYASLDLAAFYGDYDELRGFEPGVPYVIPPGYLVIPILANNDVSSDQYGAEASLDWRVRPEWRLQANYSWLKSSQDMAGGALPQELTAVSPTHQFSLRSSLDLPHGLAWDLWLRAVSEIPAFDVPGHVELDMRFAWRAGEQLEVSLVGQNLLAASHREFGALLIQSEPARIERGAYLRLDWKPGR